MLGYEGWVGLEWVGIGGKRKYVLSKGRGVGSGEER